MFKYARILELESQTIFFRTVLVVSTGPRGSSAPRSLPSALCSLRRRRGTGRHDKYLSALAQAVAQAGRILGQRTGGVPEKAAAKPGRPGRAYCTRGKSAAWPRGVTFKATPISSEGWATQDNNMAVASAFPVPATDQPRRPTRTRPAAGRLGNIVVLEGPTAHPGKAGKGANRNSSRRCRAFDW